MSHRVSPGRGQPRQVRGLGWVGRQVLAVATAGVVGGERDRGRPGGLHLGRQRQKVGEGMLADGRHDHRQRQRLGQVRQVVDQVLEVGGRGNQAADGMAGPGVVGHAGQGRPVDRIGANETPRGRVVARWLWVCHVIASFAGIIIPEIFTLSSHN